MNDKLNVSGVNRDGFGIIPKRVMQDQELTIGAKAIYAYFCSYAGAGATCFPTRDKICKDMGISGDTLGKHLKALAKKGYIQIEQVKDNGRFSHNVYTLNSEIPDTEETDAENTVTEKTGTGKTGTEIFGAEKLVTKNNNIKNNSIKNNNIKKSTSESEEFVKPMLKEVIAYCQERQNKVDPEKFMDYYESNGWRVGKSPMKDWKAAVRNWERREKDSPSLQSPKTTQPLQSNLDFDAMTQYITNGGH